MKRRIAKLTALAVLAAALPAQAQLGLPVGGLPGAVGSVVGGVSDIGRQTLNETARTGTEALARLREIRLTDLVRSNPRDLELDPAGQPAVRGELVAIGVSDAFIEVAKQQGFGVARTERLDGLGLTLVTLIAPGNLKIGDAKRRLAKIDPKVQLDFNHIYAGAGDVGEASPALALQATGMATSVRIGLVDTGVDSRHPAFTGAPIEQRGFAPGGIAPAAHGTAVASLMIGHQGGFKGAAPGGKLYAADVYGPTPRGGSATAIAGALNWMAEVKPTAVNVSLVGPPNSLLQASVAALLAKGVMVVAAVSNDGPAAPAAYPASYPGVIAVIGVDGRNRALVETGRSAHVDFAAPGADMAAASLGGGFTTVRGASFAAPIVTARLATASPATADGLAARAQKLSPAKTYGRGLIGADVRVAAGAISGR